jgi:hypothetical protein
MMLYVVLSIGATSVETHAPQDEEPAAIAARSFPIALSPGKSLGLFRTNGPGDKQERPKTATGAASSACFVSSAEYRHGATFGG